MPISDHGRLRPDLQTSGNGCTHEEGFRRCDFMFIGITIPTPEDFMFHDSDPARFKRESNPLTYWERSLLIRNALQEFRVEATKYCIVPFPISKPDKIKYFVPLNARFFVTIYDNWGRHKRDVLLSLGLNVDVMWEKEIEEKGITGALIRQNIIQGRPWEHLVASSVAHLIKELALDKRIQQLGTNEGRE